GHGRGLVAHGGGPALGRQQVDGQGRVAAGGQAAGDRGDGVVEAAVLVDDQHGPARPVGGGEGALDGPALRAREGDRLALHPRWGRGGPPPAPPPGWGGGGPPGAGGRGRLGGGAAGGQQRRRRRRPQAEQGQAPQRLP